MRFWDTSALLSLVLKDEHHRKACRWLANETEPHMTSSLATFEAENRLHVLHLKGAMTGTEHQQRLTALRLLFSSKLIVEKHLRDTRALSADCRRLISAISPRVPHGTVDVLHVATALLLKATAFHTFDANQRSLALAAGLRAC